MREDFCVFILTHGRPDRVHTYKTLQKAGYTGKVYIVIDDEDRTAEEYRKQYGDQVLQFSKEEISKTFDEGDNFEDRRTITYARNACWQLAEKVGVKYFIQLDDDYTELLFRFDKTGRYKFRSFRGVCDGVFSEMVAFLKSTPALTIAMSQGGDFIGGGGGLCLKRKAMNSFVCAIDRPFKFRGRFNEDVNTYTTEGRRGNLFFTTTQIQLNQKQTQSNAGGITELYKKFGTYVKAMTTVCHSPSCVQVGTLGDPRSEAYRIHHKINWHKTAPKIIRETHRKACQSKIPE
jgi:hypothetical protein